MATIKLVWRSDKVSKNGTAPIYLRITESRKSRFLSTRISIAGKEWNKDREEVRKSHPDYAVLNDELTRLKSKATTTAISVRHRTRGNGSAAAVKQELVGNGGGSLLTYAEAYADRQAETDHFWDARNIRSMIKKLRSFVRDDDLSFAMVDRAFLKRFESYMQTKHGNAQNTRAKNLQMLRRIITHAVQDGLKGC